MKTKLNLILSLWLLLTGLTPGFSQVRYKATQTCPTCPQIIYRESEPGSGRFTVLVDKLPTDATRAKIGGRVLIPYAPEPFATYNWSQFGVDKYYSPNFRFALSEAGHLSVNERRRYGMNMFDKFVVEMDFRAIAGPEAVINWTSQLRPGEGLVYGTENTLQPYDRPENFFTKSLHDFAAHAASVVYSLGYGQWENYGFFVWNLENSIFSVTPGQQGQATPYSEWSGNGMFADWNTRKNQPFQMETANETITLEILANRGKAAWGYEMEARRAARMALLCEMVRKKANPNKPLKVSIGYCPYAFYVPSLHAIGGSGSLLEGTANVQYIGGDAQGNITFPNLPGIGTWTVNLSGDGLKHSDFIQGYHYELGPPDFDQGGSQQALYNSIFINKTSGFTTQAQIWGAIDPGNHSSSHYTATFKGWLQLNRQWQTARTGQQNPPIMVQKEKIYESSNYQLPFPNVQNVISRDGNPNHRETPRLEVQPVSHYSSFVVTRFFAGDDPGWGWFLFPVDQVGAILRPNLPDPVEGRMFYNYDLHTTTAIIQARADMQPYERYFPGSTLVEDPEVQVNQNGTYTAYSGTEALNYNQGGWGADKPAFMLRYKPIPGGGWRVLVMGGDRLSWTQEKTHKVRMPGGGLNGNIFQIKLRGPSAQVFEFVVKSTDVGQTFEAVPIAQPNWEKPGYAGRIGIAATPTTPNSVPNNVAARYSLAANLLTIETSGDISQLKFERTDGTGMTGTNPDGAVLSSGVFYSSGPNSDLTYTKKWTATFTPNVTAKTLTLTFKQAGGNTFGQIIAMPSSGVATASTIFNTLSNTPTPTLGPKAYSRVLVVGNSITRDTWDGNTHGRAATTPANDWLHKFTANLQSQNPSVVVRQLGDGFSLAYGYVEGSHYEQYYWRLNESGLDIAPGGLARYNPVAAWQPELIVMELGDNITDNTHDLAGNYTAFINQLKSQYPSAKVLIGSTIITTNSTTNSIFQSVASANGWTYVNLQGITGATSGNAAHPNDVAMQEISNRYWVATPNNTLTTPTPTPGTWLTYTDDPSIWSNDLTTLENATIKLQYRKSIGGVLWWAGLKSNNRNLIQTHLRDGGPYWDTGRSYGGAWYASPSANTAFTIDGNTQFGIGYDPVWGGSINSQLADGSQIIKAAKVTDATRGTVLCLQVRPKQWDFVNKPADFVLNHEFWIAADNAQGHRMQVVVEPRRSGVQAANAFSGQSQEEPGMYVISALHKRMVRINGVDIDKYQREAEGSPENYYTDNNAIYSGNDDLSQGLMIYTPENNCMGSFRGDPMFGNQGEATDISFGYMQSKPYRNLDSPGMYEQTIYLIVGSYNDCKTRVGLLPQHSEAFDFDFSDVSSLQHGWSNGNEPWKVENGAWTLAIGQGHTDGGQTSYRANISSPFRRWQASGISTIAITGAITAGTQQLKLTWQKVQSNGSLQEFSKVFTVTGDGVERTYTVPVSEDGNWSGIINRVGVQAVSGIPSNAKFIVKRIRKLDGSLLILLLIPTLIKRRNKRVGVRNQKPAKRKKLTFKS